MTELKFCSYCNQDHDLTTEFWNFDKETPICKLERLELLYEPCCSKDELQNHIRYFLNIDLPDYTVDEMSNSNPMDFVWQIYRAMHTGKGPTRVVVAASRNTAKTLTACIVRFYGLIHFRRSGTHLAAVKTQSDSATAYLNKMIRIDGVREFVTVDNTRDKKLANLPNNSHTKNSDCELRIAVATMSGVNSQRGSLNIKDEIDLINAQILSEASFISDPTRDEHQFDPIEVYLSSRKSNSGPVQKLLDEAEKGNNEKLAYYKWSWADWMRKCTPETARTAEPKIKAWIHEENLKIIWDETEFLLGSNAERQLYKEISAFEGCRTCPAFLACQSRAIKQLSESPMLRTVSFIADRLMDAGDAGAIISQGLNWKPESTAVVFRTFNRRMHFLKAISFYKWCIGSYFMPEGVAIEEIVEILNSGDSSLMALISPTKRQIYQALRRAGWKVHYGIDWGSVDPAVCIVGAYHRPTRRLAILHTVGMTGFPNDDWAKHVHATVWPEFPCDLVCPDMADINSPIYFGRLKMPCHDKKPARIEPGVSQLRSFLWNPALQQSHFALLDDSGNGGLNNWTAECMEKWTYKKTVMGYDYHHFEDNEFTHPIDSMRYLADPWIADMKTSFSAHQPKPEIAEEISAKLGDPRAMAELKRKQELKHQLKTHFAEEFGMDNIFTDEDRLVRQKLAANPQGWERLNVNKDDFLEKERDPNEAESLPDRPKTKIRFKF